MDLEKETPKEEQITEYKIKKSLILREFIKVLNKVDSSLILGTRQIEDGEEEGHPEIAQNELHVGHEKGVHPHAVETALKE